MPINVALTLASVSAVICTILSFVFIGAIIGVFTMALMVASGQEDHRE